METEFKEVKLVRLRDIVLYHLQGANPNIGGDKLDALERDINVYIKNFLMTLNDIDGKVSISFVGDNNDHKTSIHTGR